MILNIKKDRTLVLDEPADLKRFKVVVHAPAALYAEIASPGGAGLRFQDPHSAWIKTDTLIALSSRANDAEWRANFDLMLEFCRKKGWLSADGLEVRGHVEWGPEPTSI